MPLIDVRCPNDHIAEVNRPLADYPTTPPCSTCGQPTEQVHLPPSTRWTLDPVVVYRAPDGSYRFPGDTNGQGAAKYDRAGLERIELRSFADVRRFESTMNATERAVAERRVERMQALSAQRTARTRGDLRQAMQSMSRRGRDVARAAMARNDGKPGPQVSDANFHVDVFSNDRSNREESRGPDGRRRRD